MTGILWVHWETAPLFQPVASPSAFPSNAVSIPPIKFLAAQAAWLCHLIQNFFFAPSFGLALLSVQTTWDYLAIQGIAFFILCLLLQILSKHTVKDTLVFGFCVFSLWLWASCYLEVLRGLECKLEAVNHYAAERCTSWVEALENCNVRECFGGSNKYTFSCTTPARRCDIANLTDWGNHPFSLANGSLWVFGLVWAMITTGFTPYRRKIEHLPTHLSKGPILAILFSLLQVYTWTPFVSLWLLASDAALSAILCYSLTSQVALKEYSRASWTSFAAPFNTARLVLALIAATVDGILWFGGYPSPFWQLCLEVGLLAWAACWFLKMTASYKRMPPENAFIVYSLGQCVLVATIAKLQQMFFFEHAVYILAVAAMWYLAPTTKAYAQVPDFAAEANRRITMFSEAPVMEPEPTLFPAQNHHSDVFWVLSTFCTGLWLLTAVALANHTIWCDKAFCVNGLAVMVFCFIGVWSAFQISTATGTREILNWRGLFFSFHEHNWVARYTLTHALILLSTLCAVFMLGVANLYVLPRTGGSSVVTVVCVIAVAKVISCGILLPFMRIWVRILSSFEFFTSEEWTDAFWKKMSPHLRDLLYWRPVQPDGYIPPRPFYVGFDRKINMRLVLIITWALIGLAIFAWLQIPQSGSPFTAFTNLSYALVTYVLFLKEPRYRDDVSADVRNLRDYVFFEKLVQAVFAICIGCGVFYVLYFYEWGLLAFIAYWLWQVK